jgi:wobble nucleotide-excising tRNase
MKQMNNFTKQEQLGLLKRGVTRRLVGANPAIKEKESEIEKITNVRLEFVDRIEKYADDEVVVNMLNAQLSEYDRQYAGTKQNYLNSIEEIKESEPTVKKVLKYIEKIEKGNKDGTLLYLLLDLFFQPILTDWNEMEESMKQEMDNDNG